MANIIVQTPPQNILVINQSTEENNDNIISTNLNISDDLYNFISIVAVDRGLPGVPGERGPSGEPGLQGPIGPAGPIGLQGIQGIPGSGINEISINNTLNLNNQYSTLNIIGSGDTVVFTSPTEIIIGSEQSALAIHNHYPNEIIGLQEYIDDRTNSLLEPGTGIYINYDDALSSLTINVTGLTIGKDVQPFNSGLSNLSNLVTTSGDYIYATGNQRFTTGRISSAGQALIDDLTPQDQRNTLGLGSIATKSMDEYAKIVGDNTFNGNQSFSDGSLSRFSAYNNDITSNSYSMQQSDNGKIVVFSANSVVNVTVPDNLLVGFNCLLVQTGSGQVKLSGNYLANRLGHTKLVGQYSIATLVKITNNLVILSGDTTNLNNN
jgi:hypothetical protein